MTARVLPAVAPTASQLRQVLVVLCSTEIVSWGVLFYAFPVLAAGITADTGWSATALTAAFSAGQLVAAVVGVPVGRWIDRNGPRTVMTAGSLLAVPAVVVIATAQSYGWFLTGWLLAGVAMGAVLYPPAFAALTRWHGTKRIRALTALTLVAGLASTVFAPLTAWLLDATDWRTSYLVLAAVLAVVTLPAHWFGLRVPWPPHLGTEHHEPPGHVARSRPFVMLAIALSIATFTFAAVVVNLVALLLERGVDTGTAALALGLGGAGQVAGRIFYPAFARRVGARARTVVIVASIAVTTALLAVVTGVGALITAAILAGTARGVFTLLQATAVTERWGSAHYGHLTGLLSAPLTISMALAPFAGAAMAHLIGGYDGAFLVLAAATAVAALLALATVPRRLQVTWTAQAGRN